MQYSSQHCLKPRCPHAELSVATHYMKHRTGAGYIFPCLILLFSFIHLHRANVLLCSMVISNLFSPLGGWTLSTSCLKSLNFPGCSDSSFCIDLFNLANPNMRTCLRKALNTGLQWKGARLSSGIRCAEPPPCLTSDARHMCICCVWESMSCKTHNRPFTFNLYRIIDKCCSAKWWSVSPTACRTFLVRVPTFPRPACGHRWCWAWDGGGRPLKPRLIRPPPTPLQKLCCFLSWLRSQNSERCPPGCEGQMPIRGM